MTPESPTILENLLRENDLGWMIDMFTPRDRAVTVLLEHLQKLTAEWHRRFQTEVSFTPETLKAEAERNPHKIRAFLQALGVSNNPKMLVMVWRILQGRSIREVTMNYREQDRFSFEVTLALPGQTPDERDRYHTEDIKDAALLRHFGITTVDGRPLFEGFFPLRKN